MSTANTTRWATWFDQGLEYSQFLENHGTPGDRDRWQLVYNSVTLTDAQLALFRRFEREMHVLCMAGAWCGDCVAQCPIWQHFAKASDRVVLRFIDRDAIPELAEELQICGAPRVPQFVILSEEDKPVARLGDRTLAKYRQMAAPLLGFPNPETSTVDVVQDWLDELERAQYLLRLSPHLRSLHGD